jgi:hypothetical protein
LWHVVSYKWFSAGLVARLHYHDERRDRNSTNCPENFGDFNQCNWNVPCLGSGSKEALEGYCECEPLIVQALRCNYTSSARTDD